MQRQSAFIRLIVLIATYISGCQGDDTTILSPQSVEAWENSDVTLTCSYTGTYAGYFIWYKKQASQFVEVFADVLGCHVPNGWLQDASLYSYSCTSNKTQSVTLLSVTKEIHGEIWRCVFTPGAAQFKSNNVRILVSVPVNSVTITPNNIVTQEENTLIELTCKSSACRPRPKFRWYIENSFKEDGTSILLESDPIESFNDDIITYTNKLSIKLNRSWNGQALFCGSQNRAEQFAMSTKISINVTYPPDGPPRIKTFENGSELNIIKDSSVMLKCLVTGGNPLPRLEWNKNNQMQLIVSDSTVTRNITWQAIDIKKEELRCQSIQLALKYTTYVSVNVLYPPDEPVIKVKSALKEYTLVTDTFSVIEGQSFTLNCSSASNPPVSMFKWNDMPPSSNPVMDIVNIGRKATTIRCIVSNVMQINYPNKSLNGSNKTSLTLDVLYPPTMNNLINKTVKEGDDLYYTCDFVNGNPGVTEIIWTGMNQTWSGQQLKLMNVSKQQEGLYRCTVHNFMSSWDGIQVVGNVSGELYLSVQEYGNDGKSATSSNVSVVAASVAGTVVGVVFVVAVIIIMVYRKRKSLSYQKKESSIQYYNVSDSKVAELNISAQVDNANSYEAFQSTGSDQQYDSLSQDDCKEKNDSDCNMSAINRSLIVYEGLRNTGFDQQYEQISPIDSHVEKRQPMVYENLQLTRNSQTSHDAN